LLLAPVALPMKALPALKTWPPLVMTSAEGELAAVPTVTAPESVVVLLVSTTAPALTVRLPKLLAPWRSIVPVPEYCRMLPAGPWTFPMATVPPLNSSVPLLMAMRPVRLVWTGAAR